MPRSSLRWPCILLLLFAVRAHAQAVTEPQAFAALSPAVDGYLDKDNVRQRFTFTTSRHYIRYKANGKVREDYTEKYEQMYIGGQPYVRLTEENGKPLSGKKAKQEQQRYDQAVQDRSGLSWTRRIEQQTHHEPIGMGLHLADFKSKFARQFIGLESVDGAQLLHFHAVTVSNAMDSPNPVSPREMDLWVDPATKSLVKTDQKLLADDIGEHLRTGSTLTLEYFLLDGVLCVRHMHYHYQMSSGESDDVDVTYADYKKFSSTSRILPDTETIVSPNP